MQQLCYCAEAHFSDTCTFWWLFSFIVHKIKCLFLILFHRIVFYSFFAGSVYVKQIIKFEFELPRVEQISTNICIFYALILNTFVTFVLHSL